jgi:hypothetical protein
VVEVRIRLTRRSTPAPGSSRPAAAAHPESRLDLAPEPERLRCPRPMVGVEDHPTSRARRRPPVVDRPLGMRPKYLSEGGLPPLARRGGRQ